jgi:hypothetical protein
LNKFRPPPSRHLEDASEALRVLISEIKRDVVGRLSAGGEDVLAELIEDLGQTALELVELAEDERPPFCPPG